MAGRDRILRRETVVPVPLDEAFSFFADAQNLERITPPFLRFRILTPLPIAMGEGTLIDYRMRLYGAPLRWRTRIDAWEPPHRFVDVQIRGPYAQWIHEHVLSEHSEGTHVLDTVRYRVPGGPFEPLAHLLVAPTLRRIFDYRQASLALALREVRPRDEGSAR